MTYAPAVASLSIASQELPESAAPRLRRPQWRDPRLLTGVVIITLSVAFGSWVVSAARHTIPIFVADGALTPGEPLTTESLRVVEVRLGPGTGRYLPADEPLPPDVVALRVINDGELVPLSALGANVNLRSVALPVTSGLSDRIQAGAVVDVWFVPEAPVMPGEPRELLNPRTLAQNVVVEQIDKQDGAIVVDGTVTLHALVPSDILPTVLAALATDGEVTVVPVAGGVQ